MNEQNRIFSMNLKRLLSAKNVSQAEAAKPSQQASQKCEVQMKCKQKIGAAD